MDQNNNTPKQVPENPRFKRMQEEVQQMYDIFKKEVDIDTVMNESEFEKYKLVSKVNYARGPAYDF